MKFSEILQNFGKYFEECTGLSSIHGIKFVGDRRRSVFERLLWLGIWLVSVIMCSKYVMQTYNKWETSPVFVTIGTGQVPIHDVAYPAVTICPESKTDTDIYYYPDMFDLAYSDEANMTVFERLQFEYITVICNRSAPDLLEFMRKFYFDSDMLHFVRNITPPFDQIFKKCQFSGVVQKCEEMFTPIFTRDGLCFSFNILDHKEMYREDVEQFMDFNKGRNSVCFNEPYTDQCENVYPRRASYAGVEAGLLVELGVLKKNLDYRCGTAWQGYKVIVHDPSEMPTPDHNHFRLPLDQVVFAAMKPDVIVTKKDLRSYAAHQRKCYFDDEKPLRHFRFYSQHNCEVECLIYLLSEGLGCVDFYLPRTKVENDTQFICGAKLLHYVEILEKLLVGYVSNTENLNLTPELETIKQELQNYSIADDTKKYCDCLPSCTSVEYSFETSQTEYIWKEFTLTQENAERRSLVNIYFKQSQYIPMQREEMFGSMDFIAYCGGLLGLFIGFSFISLIEVVYFLTLRIGCNVRMFGRKLWHGSDE